MWHVDARRRTRQIRDRSVFGQRASRQLGFCRLACPKPLRSRAPICRVELFWTTGFSPTGVLSGHLSENATVADYGLSAGLPTWVFNMSCQLGLSIWAAGPQAWLSVRAASLGCQPGLPTGVPPDPGRRTPCARPPQTKDRIPRCPTRQADSCPVCVGQPSPLRKGLGRQGPSRPYVPCRHVTSCPPSINLLPQKHIGTTRSRGFSVFC